MASCSNVSDGKRSSGTHTRVNQPERILFPFSPKYSGSGRPEAADKLYGPISLYDDEKRVGSAARASQKKIT